MTKKSDEQTHPQESKIKINKKLIGILAAIVIVLFLAVLLFSEKSGLELNENNPGPTGSEQQENSQNSQANEKKFNPLVNPHEVEKVESAIRKKIESSGGTITPKPEYKFKYKLDPGFRDNKSSMLIKTIFAASKCNIDSAPSELSVYTLKEHLNIVDAKNIASQYNINDDPSGSVPSIDGTTFKYYFSDSLTTQFLEIMEASGLTYWHRVIGDEIQTDVGLSGAQNIAQEEITKHNLSANTVLKSSGIDPASPNYLMHYEKDYDGLIMTDKSSILSLGASNSVCGVTASKFINFIDAGVTKNGFIQKIKNKTRQVLGNHKVKRATLEDAIAEYQDNPPVEPIVIGNTASTADVVIDEAVLVWYDYGESIPQTAYIPMYLTSGRSTGGARVFTLFPASTLTELNNTGDPVLNSGKRDSLQLYTFNPPVAKNPPPPKFPLSGTPYPSIPGFKSGIPGSSSGGKIINGGFSSEAGFGMPGSASGKCSGGLVDYDAQCTDSSGMLVCTTFIGLETDESGKNDPWGVCKNGCQTKSGSLNLSSGANPCAEFLKSNGLNTSGQIIPPAFNYNGGPVQCQIQGCPC